MSYSQLTIGLFLFALVGCNNSNPQQTSKESTAPTPTTQDASSKATPNQKTYRVLTYPRYAPYQHLDEKGNIIGFDVDMINAIAQSQGFAVEIVSSPWSGMLDQLNADKADLVISGISRQQAGGDEKFTLSQAYLHGKDAIVSKANITDINTMNDMVGRNIGVQSDTIFADALIQRKGKNSPTLTQSATSYLAFTDVVNDKVEAVYAHENILRHYAKSHPDVKFNFSGTGEGFNLYDMVIVAKKGNDELIQKVNAGIQKVHQNGTYQKLHLQWFGVEPPKPTQP